LIWLNIWIDLVQDRDQQLDLVEEAMNLLVPQNARNFLTSRELLTSQEGFST
jgi:hypothetical protein